MEFEKRKAVTLALLGSSVTDKSPKGSLDEPIIPLLNTINQHPSYFTTSSCSGRISILFKPKLSQGATTKKKARGGTWVYITHDLADPDSVLDLLFPPESTQLHPADQPGELVFRFEPLIIAVECKGLGSAQSFVSTAIACGFRESGITSCGDGKRVIIAIRCSIRMEVPLGDTGKLMVSPEYVRFLVGIANEKMEANRKRSDGFFEALRSGGFAAPAIQSCENGDMANEVDYREDDGNDGDDAGDNFVGGNGGENLQMSHGPSQFLDPISKLPVVGESIEKLYLWGHSACAIDKKDHKEVLVFGGFGGLGRHARRNESLLLNPRNGTLKAITPKCSPSPRLGHTSSLGGNRMFVIGGRADPLNILSDVWVLDTSNYEWTSVECTGSVFPPRHRHAAAVVGSKIYVFGGLSNYAISSSLHVLDTDDLRWKEIIPQGEWPTARHSHAMVAYGSELFMFGGYNGEKALADLYAFDVRTCLWKLEKVAGKHPPARFSHSMFVYKDFIGIIGGCPVRQHCQELALLDLKQRLWRNVIIGSMNKELFVRCTACVVGDDLIVIGGGAACYAFGTKFSEPVKINLLQLATANVTIVSSETGEKHVACRDVKASGKDSKIFQDPEMGGSLNRNAEPCVIRLERKCAKLGKDILKKFSWLDLQRKVYSPDGGLHLCFPVTEKFSSIFPENKLLGKASDGLNLLKELGATKLIDEVAEVRKLAKSPLQKMNEAVTSLIEHKGLPAKLLEELPSRWERLGDIVVLPATSFKDSAWNSVSDELWPAVARSLNASRLARQGRVAPTGTRDSTLEILMGDNGWVEHHENGVLYSFDATNCMFSWGNLSEKLRMGNMDCRNEVVVDLFAGIGYFVLPFLVRAKAKLVYACEWNPHAIEALKRNIQANSVSDRCIVLEGDNRITAPVGVADRVCLGLIPTSEGSWATAVKALRSEGGVLHVHGNVKDSEESLWIKHVSKSINESAKAEGRYWEIKVEHVERVKWYAPHIRHLVADVRCRLVQQQ